MIRDNLELIDVIRVSEKQLVEVISNYKDLGYMLAVDPNRERVNSGLTGETSYITSYKITVFKREGE